QLLDDRAWPAMRDDHRKRVFMLRAYMNEMDVEPVDLGHELRQSVELRLDLAPVMFRRPIMRELPDRRELHALRVISAGFLIRPLGRLDAPVQVGEVRFGDLHMERTDRGRVGGSDGLGRGKSRYSNACS